MCEDFSTKDRENVKNGTEGEINEINSQSTDMDPKNTGVNNTGAKPDDQFEKLYEEALDDLEDEIIRKLGLLEAFPDPEVLQKMICFLCCETNRMRYEYMWDCADSSHFVRTHRKDKGDAKRYKEMIDKSLNVAAMYVTLVILCKQGLIRKQNLGRKYEL